VHHNDLNQVVVNGAAGMWDLSGPPGCNDPNIFACYDGSPLPSAFVGVAAAGGVTVLANQDTWQNAAPAAGTDFSTAGTATFLPTPPAPVCGVSAITCP
jgi:hypothetical protein